MRYFPSPGVAQDSISYFFVYFVFSCGLGGSKIGFPVEVFPGLGSVGESPVFWISQFAAPLWGFPGKGSLGLPHRVS